MEKTKESLREEKALKKLQRPWYKKKRFWLLGVMLLGIIVLFGACAAVFSAVDEELSNSNTTTEKAITDGADTNESENTKEKVSKKNIVVIDDANVKVVITGFASTEDDIWGDSADLKFEMTNKTKGTLVIQSSEISVDGVMADDLVIFSETVAAGKTAKGNLSFEAWFMEEGEDIPAFEDNIEGKIIVLNESDFNQLSESPFKVNLK